MILHPQKERENISNENIAFFVNFYLKLLSNIVLLSQIYQRCGFMLKKMFLSIIVFCILFSGLSCGKKANPYPTPSKTVEES